MHMLHLPMDNETETAINKHDDSAGRGLDKLNNTWGEMASSPDLQPDTGSSAVVQFGPFELDRSAAELRKQGTRIRLQPKPMQILCALVERPGRIVTRDELKARLWPDDTFVDFESGLNTAVNRLRIALGDSAEHPRYVETEARNGYRFIAPTQPKQETAVRGV